MIDYTPKWIWPTIVFLGMLIAFGVKPLAICAAVLGVTAYTIHLARYLSPTGRAWLAISLCGLLASLAFVLRR